MQGYCSDDLIERVYRDHQISFDSVWTVVHRGYVDLKEIFGDKDDGEALVEGPWCWQRQSFSVGENLESEESPTTKHMHDPWNVVRFWQRTRS